MPRFIKSAAFFLLAAIIAACMAMPAAGQDVGALQQRKDDTQSEYSALSQELNLSKDKVSELESQVASVRKEKAALTAALVQSAKTEKKLSEDIEVIEGRIEDLKQQGEAVRASLLKRRGVLAEVLGALERVGLNPPPAIVVEPKDALAAVRSAILLGAVVPEMRAETEKLAADLNELNRVTNSITAEREKLKDRVADQLAEKKRLSLLIDEKQKIESQSNANLAEERQKAEDLGSRAQTLRELIASLQAQIEGIRETAAEARTAEEQRLEKARKNAESNSPDDHQIASINMFSKLRGKIALPVTGRIKGHYGDPDGVGGQLNGNTVQTQSRAIVTAPSDGLVLYAGPFRSYGQLLILDAGDGYHVILAGMDRISVGPGQSVVAGEPVGIMGDHRLASSVVIDDSDTAPSLYIELRKDGRPIDPAPWWALGNPGRTGNDT